MESQHKLWTKTFPLDPSILGSGLQMCHCLNIGYFLPNWGMVINPLIWIYLHTHKDSHSGMDDHAIPWAMAHLKSLWLSQLAVAHTTEVDCWGSYGTTTLWPASTCSRHGSLAVVTCHRKTEYFGAGGKLTFLLEDVHRHCIYFEQYWRLNMSHMKPISQV